MKELWFYMGNLFQNSEKDMKQIKKCQSLAQYRSIVDRIFA